MRKRFPISTHLEFSEALKAKRIQQSLNNPDPDNPEDTRKIHQYQIRKYHNGFRLVERLDSTEAAVINTSRELKKRKRRASRSVL